MSEHPRPSQDAPERRDALDREAIREDFRAAVNMSANELARWLETEESRCVGWVRDGESEAVGHASGRRIVALLRKRGAYSDDDYRHMRKVTGYVRRHLAQGGPRQNWDRSRWRYSLMNWGHDPMKD